jgi:Na+-transporting NADH:ubiquinone oxidoreductase subunit NqrE
MTEYLLILLSAVFVNNIVMVKILGLCPFMGVSKKLEAAIGMGAATTFVLTLASGSSYLINHYLLGPELSYLTTLSFIVVIAGIVHQLRRAGYPAAQCAGQAQFHGIHFLRAGRRAGIYHGDGVVCQYA